MICPHCGKSVADGSMFCGGCGKEIVTEAVGRKCPSCGAANSLSDLYCTRCGKPMDESAGERKCPSCGARNAEYVVYCSSCGKELPGTPRTMSQPEPYKTEEKTSGSKASTYCPRCGREITIFDYECPYCRANLTKTEMDGEISSHKSSTGMIIAGIVLILVGIYAIATGILLLSGASLAPAGDYDVSGYLTCCGLLEVAFGGAAALGGYFATQEEKWLLAMVGALLGMFTIGPIFLGSIASLVCLILIAVAKPNFPD